MKWTDAQARAIQAQGNVLLVAGAGTGKTRTLVDRCLRDVLEGPDPLRLDQVLMVTFTEAAASEMKSRIRARLAEEAYRQPDNPHIQEQLGLLDTADICTLHSFCLQFVRRHFHELHIDPRLSVLTEPQAALLMRETLDQLLRELYSSETADESDLCGREPLFHLLHSQCNGNESILINLVLRIHRFSQTQPDPGVWLDQQEVWLSQSQPGSWPPWLVQGFAQWRREWLPVLRADSKEAPLPPESLKILECDASGRTTVIAQLEALQEASLKWSGNLKRGKLKHFIEDLDFLATLNPKPGSADPLQEDWEWMRPAMRALLALARRFSKAYASAKRAQGSADFQDLEQFAVRLLWDSASNQYRPLAHHLRRQYRLVMVDEYQDINAVQDMILRAISREDDHGNRFLVGDMKQSIYRFRLANPRIFQNYLAAWRQHPGAGTVIPLSDNFRSREMLLEFANALFADLMRGGIGGIDYDQEARLRFGLAPDRQCLSKASQTTPGVEVHLVLEDGERESEEPAEDSAAEESSSVEWEAAMIARRLSELRQSQFQVWDRESSEFRPVRWSDMAILLRAVAGQSEVFARVFQTLGIPLQATRGDLFQALEIRDLMSLLQLLDNPLQDVPVLAVLRSPIVGLSLEELARIRLADKKARFWVALKTWRQQYLERKAAGTVPPELEGLGEKVNEFLLHFERWRRMSKQTPLSRQIETIFAETQYPEWLLTQSAPEQRQANLRHFLGMVQEFDHFQQQGLQRLLRFLEARMELAPESEPAPFQSNDAVQLTSIHRSKGLEFPVVVVAGLGRNFNLRDLREGVLLDEVYGLCPRIKPPAAGQSYPSLPYWLARQRQKRETLGEELRLLYVAITRARDRLLLCGSTDSKQVARWSEACQAPLLEHDLLSARCSLDWLGPWCLQALALDRSTRPDGEPAILSAASHAPLASPLFTWQTHPGQAALPAQAASTPAARPGGDPMDQAAYQKLLERLEWSYSSSWATTATAKMSVSAARQKAMLEQDPEAQIAPFIVLGAPRCASAGGDSATHRGLACHRFLQSVPLDQTSTLAKLSSEAERLEQSHLLTPAERQALDLEEIHAFWKSEVGTKIRRHAACVRRELPFTARFRPEELSRVLGTSTPLVTDDEFVIIQGIVDLAVIRPKELWVLDYKTDQARPEDLAAKCDLYRPQLVLYALALGRIYHRPATRCWLHFLHLRETVPFEIPQLPTA